MTNTNRALLTISTPTHGIAPGRYDGVWSGYTLTVGAQSIETKDGCRGALDVTVVVDSNGTLTANYR